MLPRLMRFVWIVLALACAPTETGNPSVAVEVSPQSRDVMGLAPIVQVDELVLGGVRVELATGETCTASDVDEVVVDVESYEALSRRAERVELASELPSGPYCAAGGVIYPSERIGGLLLSVDAVRLMDEARVQVRAYGTEPLPLTLSLREGFAIGEEGIAMHFLVDVDAVMGTVPELAGLRPDVDGVVYVDAERNPEVLAILLERLRGAVTLLEDLDADGEIDPDELAATIAGNDGMPR